MFISTRMTALALLAGALAAAPAWSQVQRSGGGGASAQLMMQYQQVVTERTQLQADNAKLKKELDDLKKQLEAVKQQVTTSKAGASRNQAALAAAQAASESSAKSLADSKNKMQELIGHFRETASQLKSAENERTQLQQQLAQSKAAFDQCAQRNYDLYQVNNEVLDRYAHQGAFSYLARAEPFTRLKRTQIENLVVEYRQRAEELRMKKPDAPPSAAAPPGTAAPPASPSSGNGSGSGPKAADGNTSAAAPPAATPSTGTSAHE